MSGSVLSLHILQVKDIGVDSAQILKMFYFERFTAVPVMFTAVKKSSYDDKLLCTKKALL